MAWAGKILRVNLSEGTCESEPLNMEWANAFLGSRGLASKYLYEEMDPAADALSALHSRRPPAAVLKVGGLRWERRQLPTGHLPFELSRQA